MISQDDGRHRTGRVLRRAAYPLGALPVDLWHLTLLLLRRPLPGRPGRLLLVRLPLDAVAFAVAAYVWVLLPVNWAYPLRPDVGDEPLRDTWGGPTLAGAWAVHAIGATLVFLLVGVPILNGVALLQQRFATRP